MVDRGAVSDMNSMIYHPLEEYESKFRDAHLQHTRQFFETLVQRSGVDADQNRRTVKQYDECNSNVKDLRKKLNLRRFLRVAMIITLILIPVVILKTTPKIKALRSEVEQAQKKAAELLSLAQKQMAPLNALFTDRDALGIIESTIPLISFAPCFSVEQAENMRINYDFCDQSDNEQSTLDVVAGHYNENPFLFENKLIHQMGTETYHGYKTIHWTECYRGSDGKTHTRTRSQTLHATVTKPKPFYHTQVVLDYCAQGGPDLCFTRDATHLHRKSEKEIDRYVKRGERKLKKMSDQALKKNDDFTSMSNSDFEVLFDALDRTDEVEFRTLFTPLAQTNMVDLILSKTGYGDDFHFIKQKRTNKIISQHSQGRSITLFPTAYHSYSFDLIKQNFMTKNTEFFKAVYFDFAPLWSIPMYQDRPVHSLKPIPNYAQTYSYKECEALANLLDCQHIVHARTKTPAILKSSFVASKDTVDEISICAFSYDIIQRVDFVSMLGGDGRLHSVAVPWDDYIPLQADNHFFVSTAELAKNKTVLARHNHLCMFH